MSEIRILLVDDHEVVRQGLRSLLERREHLRVVAEAGTVAEAVEAAAKEQPDVIVMDVRLPDGTGIEACRDIRADHPHIRVLMLTSYAERLHTCIHHRSGRSEGDCDGVQPR